MPLSKPPALPPPAEVLERLPGFLGTMEIALIVQDRESRIVYANRAALALLGRDADAVLGVDSFDPGWDVIHPDGSAFPAEARPVVTVLRTGAAVRDALLGIRHPDNGRRIWLSVDANPYPEDGQSVTHVVATLSDVSKQRHRLDLLAEMTDQLQDAVAARTEQLEEAMQKLEQVQRQRGEALRSLEEHAQLHTSVVSAMAEGVAVHAPDGSILAANPAAEQILGLTRGQLLGRDAIDGRWALTDEEGTPLPPERIPSEITRATGQPCRAMVLGVRRPGAERAWLQVSTEPLRDVHGQPQGGVVATFADVTAERNALLSVRERRAEFQRLTEAIPGVLWQLLVPPRAPLRFLFLSARTRELVGVEASDALADPTRIFARLHPEDTEEALRALRASPGGDGVWEQDLRVCEDGGAGEAQRYLRARAVREQRPEGLVWSGVVLDITEERKLAEQLRHSQRREAMGDLAAGVAHNFNNMLAAILPNLNEALALATDEARPVLMDAIRVSRDAAELVRQLLQTSRSDPKTRKEPVEVVQAVGDIAALCQRSFKQTIEIRTHFDVRSAPVLARSSQLQQVLLNLCINARDAMLDSTERRLLLTVCEAPKQAEFVISVRDTGCGMSTEVQQRLGEPFFTTKPVGKGTGLGLATAYSIIEELGGHIECRSEPGHGTTFSVHLPQLAGWQHSSLPPQPRDPGRFNGERVLLVDDEALVRRAIVRRLSGRGLRVVEAADGREALGVVQDAEEPFGAVLLDMSMPGMDGQEAMAELHKLQPDLPVLIMTGHVPEGANLDGADAVLLKPTDEADLVAALACALAGAASQHNTTQAASARTGERSA